MKKELKSILDNATSLKSKVDINLLDKVKLIEKLVKDIALRTDTDLSAPAGVISQSPFVWDQKSPGKVIGSRAY